MKKLLFLISFVLSVNIAYAQQPAYLRGDVIHLTNVTKTTQVFVDGKIKILTALPGSSSDSVYSKGSDGFLHLIKAVVDTTRFLNLNQTTLQTIKGNVHGLRNLTIDSALNAGGNISAGGNLVVSGISAFGGFAEFYGGIQSPYQLIFNNSITAGNNWVAKNGNEASSATLQFIYGGSGTGIKMIGNNLYDLAGNAFLKSGSTAGHAGNADSLGSQLPSYYLNRANHTGTQAESTITNLVTDLGAKATLTQLGIKQPRVIATYTIGTNTSVTATDSVSSAFGKVQAQINSSNTNITTLQGQHTSDYAAIGIKQPRLLSNYVLGSNTAVTTADSVVSAFGKLQAEINSANTAISGKQATGNYITAVTGDGTASGPGSVAFTLATVNSNVFASNTFLKIAVNGKGLITGAVAVGSSDITGALGYTPYNNTNPSGFITAASPALTGTPTAPTQATADNSTAIATTAFVQANFAATVTYFTPGMFSGLGTSVSNFNWGTSTIPLSAFNVTGTPSSTTYLRGDGTWATVTGGSGFTNPMTTAGDIITATSGGTAARLAIGSANQVLGVNAAGTALEYKTPTQGTGITINHGTGSITYAVDQTYSPNMTGNWVFSPTNGASSGTTYGTQISATNNGTSTNAFTAFGVNITNNTNGSGGLLLANFLFNGTSKLSISSTGQIQSSAGFNGGNITSGAYNQTVGTSTNLIYLTNYAPADATHQNLQSPSTIWNFPLWNSTSSAQNYVNWKHEARGAGGASPGTTWVLSSSLTTTTTPSYTDRLSLDGLTGNLTLSGGLITGGHSTIEGITSTGATGSGKFVFDASPALTGTPTVPTAAPGTNTTQAASTAFVTAAVTAGGGGATYATPSASIGLAAIPGSATTGTRSDAAPALSQAIIPIWTGKHTFSITDAASSGTNFGTVVSHTVNGTGSDAFTDFYLNRIENTTGSGSQYLARFAVNGSDKVQINNAGGITTASSITLGGGINSSGFFQTTGFNLMYFKNTATADASHTGLFGASWIDDYTAWNTSGTPAVNYIQWKQEGRSTGGASPVAQWVWAESLSTTTTPSFGDKMILDGNSNLSGLSNVSLKHIIGTSSAPTIAAGTGAGTSPTLTIGTGSTDSDGIINVTTGTSPTASGVVGTITFNSAYGASPIVIIGNGSSTFAALTNAQMPFCPGRGQSNAPTTTTFVIQAGTTALPASTTFVWTYHVIQ